jgi:hypothetical protein
MVGILAIAEAVKRGKGDPKPQLTVEDMLFFGYLGVSA